MQTSWEGTMTCVYEAVWIYGTWLLDRDRSGSGQTFSYFTLMYIWCVSTPLCLCYLCRRSGLSFLTEAFLGFKLVKERYITCSNWAAETLSPQQVRFDLVALMGMLQWTWRKYCSWMLCLQVQYAAADALVAVRIFAQLLKVKVGKGLDEAGAWQKAQSVCQGVVDVPYSRSISPQVLVTPTLWACARYCLLLSYFDCAEPGHRLHQQTRKDRSVPGLQQ